MATLSSQLPLLVAAAVILIAAGILIGMSLARLKAENRFVQILQQKETEWMAIAEENRRVSLAKSRAVIGGNFSEQLAPFLPDFPFDPTEARFVGKPIDFIVFRGLAEGRVSSVAFVEVKSGTSRLNRNEVSLRDAIENKRVEFVEYRVPPRLTASEHG
jgi:predicted Holliday junction resolvase-like endonuclease